MNLGIRNAKLRAALSRLKAYFRNNDLPYIRKTPLELCNDYRRIIGLPDLGKKTYIKYLIDEYENNPLSDIHKKKKPLQKAKKTAAQSEKRKQYIEYIKSEKWREFKNGIIKKRGAKCEKCGKTGIMLHAHHLTYERFMTVTFPDLSIKTKATKGVNEGVNEGVKKVHFKAENELESDIMILCVSCHEMEHGRKFDYRENKTNQKPKKHKKKRTDLPKKPKKSAAEKMMNSLSERDKSISNRFYEVRKKHRL